MCDVKRLATVAAALSLLTVAGGLAAFASADTGYSASSQALIVVGYLSGSIVALVGWLLVRAPWGRWSLVTAAAGGVLLASTNDSPSAIIVYAIGAASIVVMSGPWLKFWVRQHPPPGGPNRIALSLTVVAPLSPLVVGVAAYDTTHWTHWVAATAGVAASWAYGRGLPLAVWGLRVVVPVTSLAAIVTSPMGTRLVLVVGAGAVTVLAWLPGATSTSTFPDPPLPPPRPARRQTSDATD